jgi:LysM repeat protein
MLVSATRPTRRSAGRLSPDSSLAPHLPRRIATGLAALALCLGIASPVLADQTITYEVQAGDTLLGLAIQFETTPEQIAAASGLTDPNVLAIGQKLIIAVPDASAGGGNVKASYVTTGPAPTHLAVMGAPNLSQFDGSEYSPSNCGPTALSMALGALGIAADQMRLRHWADVQMGTNDPDQGTSWEALAFAARQYGSAVAGLYDGGSYRAWTIDDLKAQFAQGHPVMLLVRYWDLPDHTSSSYPGDHYIVALGFDPSDNLVYNDPAYYNPSEGHRVISQKHLQTAWTDTWVGLVRTAMAVLP